MAKKKQTATTASSATAAAKRSPLSYTAIRLFGAVLAFLGILLCMSGTSIVGILLTVFSVGMILGGFFIAVSNLRKMISSKSTAGDVLLYFFVGLVVFILGILLVIYKGAIAQWFVIIIGALIAIYGLAMLVKFIVRRRGKRAFVFDIIISLLTIVAGVLIALLTVGEIASAGNGVCFYIFGGIAAGVGALELLAY